MGIPEIIGLCGVQTIGLVLILSHKKFRTPQNFVLNMILLSMLIYFVFYYTYYSYTDYQYLIRYFICFAFISPPLIYFYCLTAMSGKFPNLKAVLPHLIIPLGLLVVSQLTFKNTNEILFSKTFLIILAAHALAHVIYPSLVLRKLVLIYQLKGNKCYTVLKYNKDKTIMIRLFVIMMLIHSVLLITRTILLCITKEYYDILEYINILFLLILSYVIAYHVITRPTAIHNKKKKQSIINFKQYSKSGLSEENARRIALQINKYFQEEKVYLNPSISLKLVSKQLKIPPHHISETLNGLLGQSFNDFTNNYRIEEFKLLVNDKKHKNYSILALAFEVGFKSKATFNISFKKFTKQTPSEYKASLRAKY